jgi:hypothetical protein
VVLNGPRKHQRLALERRRSYFGFELDTEVEPVTGRMPDALLEEARGVLADSLLAGEVVHPDASRLRRAVATLDELWRRSGGTLPAVSPDALRTGILSQLSGVTSWEEFQRSRFQLNPVELVDEATRQRLESLPGMVRVRGDAAPVEYELQDGAAVARVRLREGQAKRLRPDEVPVLDRPVRFAVQRGRHPPLLADTIPMLQAQLRRAPKARSGDGDGERRRGRRHTGKGRRHGRRH